MKNLHLIGNAHLDPVWLWQWRDGYSEVKATFLSALDRMDETPDFVFTCACAAYYQWVEECDPELFEKIRKRVQEGRWVLAGGMFIQPDMNTPSGESLARQLLYSQRYFMEKFGKTAHFGYNVDSFGHNAQVPQILAKAGMEGYVMMRPGDHENPDLPLGALNWQSLDGTVLPTYHIFGEYCVREGLADKLPAQEEAALCMNLPVMCFYGVGNHGGGPTIENLKTIDRFLSESKYGKDAKYSSPLTYFAELKNEGIALPKWENEMQHHASGCYSTHSLSKKLHRQAENALLRAESFLLLSEQLTGMKADTNALLSGWKTLLFNEFHDVMGGCCLYEGMEDVVTQLKSVLALCDREENKALQRISWRIDTMKGHPLRVRSKEEDWALWGIRGQGTPVVVFNPHPYPVTDDIRLVYDIYSARTDDGKPLPVQRVRATRTNNKDRFDTLLRPTVPAFGYTVIWVFKEEEQVENTLQITETSLENDKLRVIFDTTTGMPKSILRKDTGTEFLTAPASARLFDITHCDTWAHGVFRFDQEAGAFAAPEFSILEEGPLRATLRVRNAFGLSALEQKFSLYENSDTLRVEVRLNMNIEQKHRMVKFCFPTDGKFDVAEIPFGSLVRTGCGNEEHCQRWAAVQGENHGLALLNDGKYSYSCDRGELRLTVANTSLYADHYGQDFRDDTCLMLDEGVQTFAYSVVPYEGSWQDASLHRRADLLNRKLCALMETYHEGKLPGTFSGLTIDAENIALSALKPAEDNSGLVLRLYETAGKKTTANISLPLCGRQFSVTLTPFQMETYFIPADGTQEIRRILLTELA